jgi:hypothetical protein
MKNITIDICKNCTNLKILRNEEVLIYRDCKIQGSGFYLENELFQCESFKSNLENKESIFKRIFK